MDKKLFFNTTLSTLKPVQIIEHEVTEQRFIDIFTSIHEQDGSIAYEKEKFYFQKILVDNPVIAECTPLSLFSVFLDVATKGLTLDNSSKALCYITFRKVKKRTHEGDVWEKRALLDISGYGELVLRERANQVKYADNPEIVYINELKDCRQENTPEGVRIFHTIEYPRPASSGIAFIYVRIVRPDGSVTFGTLDIEGIERLKNFSASNNGKWQKDNNGKYVNIPGEANKLYSDSGFLKAKCLKHAFQSFPKLKLNNFSAITEGQERPEEVGVSQKVIEKVGGNEQSEIIPESEEQAGIIVKDEYGIF